MTAKEDYVKQMRIAATSLGAMRDRLRVLTETYFDRTYQVGGANAITDGDLVNVEGINSIQVGSFITLTQQLANFFDGDPLTTGDYGVALSVLREDA